MVSGDQKNRFELSRLAEPSEEFEILFVVTETSDVAGKDQRRSSFRDSEIVLDALEVQVGHVLNTGHGSEVWTWMRQR